jgi:hypothetical protein
MLTINKDICKTDTKLDAEELLWLYQAMSQDTDHPTLMTVNVIPNAIQTANGFAVHRILGNHNCTLGTYVVNNCKRPKRTPATYPVYEKTDGIPYPDVERIIPIGTTTYTGPSVTWTVRVEQAELLWALQIPDTLAAILTFNADGVFSVQKARREYDRVAGTPGATSAYIQHEVLMQPDNPTEFQVGVNPKLLIAAAQMPNSPSLLPNFTDDKHAFVVQSTGFEYQAIIMPMHLGR